MNNLILTQGLTFGPLTIKRLIRAISPNLFDSHRNPERFTPRELVAHLADFETIYQERFHLLAAHDGADIEAVEIDKRVETLNYHSSDPIEQAELFYSRRLGTMNFLSTLTEEQFGHVTHHRMLGSLSLKAYAEFLLFHDLFHIEELSEFLS